MNLIEFFTEKNKAISASYSKGELDGYKRCEKIYQREIKTLNDQIERDKKLREDFRIEKEEEFRLYKEQTSKDRQEELTQYISLKKRCWDFIAKCRLLFSSAITRLRTVKNKSEEIINDGGIISQCIFDIELGAKEIGDLELEAKHIERDIEKQILNYVGKFVKKALPSGEAK